MESLTTSVKIDVSNLESNNNFVEISSYISKKWVIKSVVPVTEGGKPFLLFILQKRYGNKDYVSITILACILLVEIINLLM
jgi:hypothetical protein